MLRILQVVNIMDRAGLETMLMNYYRNIDRSKVQFDFLTHRNIDGAYDDEIKRLGGRIYHAPRLYPNNYPKYFKFMREFFEEHQEYDIVHSHIDSMSYFPLKAAKDSGIRIRIGHSHNTKLDRDIKMPIKYWALKNMPKVANTHFACGEEAGRFMYPQSNFEIIHNAIDLEKFQYNKIVRDKIRKKLKIEECFVIGHVGRFSYVKNQLFLLDVFNEILKKEKNSRLVLIGKGEDEYKIRNKAKKLGIEKNVLILIDRKDVPDLYQAFDVFVMPSIFEGLPVAGVEVQANGLPCVFSDTISKEIVLSNSVYIMSLKKKPYEWADKILSIDRSRNENAGKELCKNGYDIKSEAMKLQNWYIRKYQNLQNEEQK